MDPLRRYRLVAILANFITRIVVPIAQTPKLAAPWGHDRLR